MGSNRSHIQDYTRFVERLKDMHKVAKKLLDLIESSGNLGKMKILQRSGYRPLHTDSINPREAKEEEHYWTLSKLFIHAMYIPMFIQIGKKYFDELIYIDTHSGAGLVRVGGDKNDVVLGSPLISLVWPRLIAFRVRTFRGIRDGFHRYVFIEKDKESIDLLKALVNNIPQALESAIKDNMFNSVLNGDFVRDLIENLKNTVTDERKIMFINEDCNSALLKYGAIIPEHSTQRTLIYMFVDPVGELSSQLRIPVLKKFLNYIQTRKQKADLGIVVMDSHLARGLSRAEDVRTRKQHIEMLFGVEFKQRCSEVYSVMLHSPRVKASDILNAFECVLTNILGYRHTEVFDVKFSRGHIYSMIFAVSKEAKWLSSFREYIETKMPKDYKQLKRLWFIVSEKQRKLTDFMRGKQINY